MVPATELDLKASAHTSSRRSKDASRESCLMKSIVAFIKERKQQGAEWEWCVNE